MDSGLTLQARLSICGLKFGDERLGQGIGNSAQALEEDSALAAKLEAAIREKAGLTEAPQEAEDAEDSASAKE